MANKVLVLALLISRVLRSLEAVPVVIGIWAPAKHRNLLRMLGFTETKTRISLPVICLVFAFVVRRAGFIMTENLFF